MPYPSLPPCSLSAAAPRLLLLAGEACGNVLRGEPGNSKARYRRALVRHRQGRPREAAADLAAIPRDEADAAVAALQVEVDAALRRQG